jgi:hypothetical protein
MGVSRNADIPFTAHPEPAAMVRPFDRNRKA